MHEAGEHQVPQRVEAARVERVAGRQAPARQLGGVDEHRFALGRTPQARVAGGGAALPAASPSLEVDSLDFMGDETCPAAAEWKRKRAEAAGGGMGGATS